MECFSSHDVQVSVRFSLQLDNIYTDQSWMFSWPSKSASSQIQKAQIKKEVYETVLPWSDVQPSTEKYVFWLL